MWRRNAMARGRGPIISPCHRYQKNNFPSLSDQTLPKQPSPEITSGIPEIAVCARACQRVVPSEGAGVVPFMKGRRRLWEPDERMRRKRDGCAAGMHACMMRDAEGDCLSLTLN
jgi:hypothetical protein